MRILRAFFAGVVLSMLSSTHGFSQPKYRSLNEIDQEFRTSRVHAEKRIGSYLKANPEARRTFTAKGVIYSLVDVSDSGVPQYFKTDNAGAAISVNVPDVRKGGSLGLSLSGINITIGVWDAGRISVVHPELSSGVTQMEVSNGNDNHSTHVAGTMIALGLDPLAHGMASSAMLLGYDFNNDVSEMTSQAKPDKNSLLLSNHSYGTLAGWGPNASGTMVWYGDPAVSNVEDYKFGFYDVQSSQWDGIAYNAPYYLIVKSAGNDRGESGSGPQKPDGSSDGYDCIPTFGVAKNILTVGAVNKLTDYQIPSDVVMSSFSGWGPTDDGRIKPDLVAPGVSIYSTIATFSSYAIYSGTSMAAPTVTGSLALLQELYMKAHGVKGYSTGIVPMRSSTLKALVLHTTREAGLNPGPDYSYGWGLLDVGAAAKQILEEDSTHLISELVISSGGKFELPVTAKPGTKLTATLVWADPPGNSPAPSLNPKSRMLVNDLDLRLTDASGTVIQMPWILNPSIPSSAAIRGDNIRDNVEKLEMDNLGNQTYTLTVTHKGNLAGGRQEFSLIVSYEAPVDQPQTYYWVGDSGSWDDSNHWSLTSGGTPAGSIPSVTDNVQFDENSFLGYGGLVTTNSDVSLNSLKWLSSSHVELSLNDRQVTIAGGMRDYYGSNYYFTTSGANILLTGSAGGRHSIDMLGQLDHWNLNFDGDASWNVGNLFSINELRIVRGTVSLNSAAIQTNRILGEGAGAKLLKMKNSRVEGLDSLFIDLTNLPIATDINTLIIADPPRSNTINLADKEYSGVVYIRNGAALVSGTSSAVISGNGSLLLQGSLKIKSLSLSGGSSLTLEEGSTHNFSENLFFPTSATNRVSIKSGGPTQATMLFEGHEKICMDYVDINNVAVAGNSMLNAGSHSTLVNAPNWEKQVCGDLAFPDLNIEYPCVNGLVSFINTSSGPISTWIWDFGDGTIKSQTRPLNGYHSYAATNDPITATLTVKNNTVPSSASWTFSLMPNTLPDNYIEYEDRLLSSHITSGKYQWLKDGEVLLGADSKVLNYDIVKGATYNVVIFDETCNRISQPFLVTALSESKNGRKSFQAYPIPTSEVLQFDTDMHVSEVSFSDALGHRFPVRAEVTGPGQYRVNVSPLSSGLYILKVSDGTRSEWMKVIITR